MTDPMAPARRRPLWRIKRTVPGLWHVYRWCHGRRPDSGGYYIPWMPFRSGAEAIAAFDSASRERP